MDENEAKCNETEQYESDMPDKEEEEVPELETQGANRKPRTGAIWKFFKKVQPLAEKRAKCTICHEVKSYRSSTTNLMMHLKLKHEVAYRQYMQIKKIVPRTKNPADVDTTETDCNNPVRQSKSRCRDPTIWKYFENVSAVEKMAKCNFCQQIRSYRSSITNLKTHLSLKHSMVVENDQKLMKRILPGYQKKRRRSRENFSRDKSKMWEFLKMETDNDDESHNGTNDTGNLNFSSEITRHFDVEDDETICGLCRVSIPPGLEEMKNHLEEKHSNVLDEVAQKVLDAASEEENVLGDDDLYTEIVYLEDDSDKNDSTREKHQKRPKLQKAKVKTERNASTSSDEVPLKPKHKKYQYEENKKEPDELESFINYITVLLKKVPNESSPKLHLDIINLIMNATQPQYNILTSNINFNPANVNASKFESVSFNPATVNTVLDKSIVITQNSTSDVNCMNAQRIAVPVQHFVALNDDNTVSQVVSVPNTQMSTTSSITNPSYSNT